MSVFTYTSKFAALLAATLLLTGCMNTSANSPFIGAEPEVGSVQSRAPRTLRLYYEELPDVPRSSVVLEGPNGALNTRGMHSMGANDLMMEINDDVVNGEYTVTWTTYVGEDPTEHQGQFSFIVQAD